MKIGIVGAGKIGSWFVRLFRARGLEVGVYDVSKEASKKARKLGADIYGSLENLAIHSDHIMVSTPQDTVVKVLENLKSLALGGVIRGTTIYDTATFKEDVMPAYRGFPNTVRVASIHPLFGPGASRPEKHVVAVIPIPGREADSRHVEKFYKSLGFRVVTVDHATHDEAVSLTIGASYAVGLALAGLLRRAGNPEAVETLAGTTFRYLSNHYKSLLLDPPRFLTDILARDRVRRRVRELSELLAEALRNPERLVEEALELRRSIGREKLEKAYRALYKCLEDVIDSS